MANKSRTQYSILNIATGIGGYVVNTILGLVCRMFFTRALSADYLGINGLFTNILTVLSLAELGIGAAIVYALYEPLAKNDEEKIASLVKYYGKCYRIIGVVVAIVGLALMPFLHYIIKEPPKISENLFLIYGLYLLNTVITYFFSYRSSLLQAAQKSYLVTGLSYIITILQSIIQIVVLVKTHNYMIYLAILIIGSIVFNVTISYIAKKQYPFIANKDIKPISNEEKKPLFKNVKSLIIIKIAGLSVNSSDNLIITYFSGLATVGLASNYILLSGTLNTLLSQVFNGINASVGNHNVLEDKSQRIKMFNVVNLANFWLFGWAAIGIVVCSTDIVKVLFGTDYILPINIPIVIALNFYIVGMQSAVWTYKNTLGLFKYGRYLLFFTAIINLGLSIWWGKFWGLFGIYLATSVARLLTNAWYDPFAVFKYGLFQKFKDYVIKYILYFAIMVLTAGICYFICSFIHYSDIVNMILKLIVCIVIPNIIFVVIFFKKEEFKYIKNTAIRYLKKFKK